MAAPLTLKTAIGSYPHTLPLKDGTVTSPRLCLDHVEVAPANRAFRPMVNQLAYDVSELALVTLMLARAFDRQIVGVPVILMQQSAYGMFLVPEDSRLRDPRQLAGCKIGVRAYTQTTGVWLRGMLHDQFGLGPDRVNWLTFEAAHVDGLMRAAKNAAGTTAPADGLEVNRGALTLLARYAFEQHITPRTLTAEELFSAT